MSWTKESIRTIYDKPLLALILEAANIHQQNHNYGEVQVSSLLSVKTGGCPEDCSYCPQAARYHTDVETQKMMDVEEVLTKASIAKENGASRMCLGAAWREVRDNRDFDKVLQMVSGINQLGMEVCCTLGMLNENQAERLANAGLYAYNHNIDTSEEHYGEVISTRTYDDRINTIKNVQKANITVCSGGIIGLGESDDDRIGMLYTLTLLPKAPESIPINSLVAVKGTPLENQEPVSIWEMVRMIATTRIVFPETVVRLSAGRTNMTMSDQALCFIAGANSIFAGDKLLTTPNPEFNEDKVMFELLGLKARKPFKKNTEESEKTVECHL